jgi:hypothetical protein
MRRFLKNLDWFSYPHQSDARSSGLVYPPGFEARLRNLHNRPSRQRSKSNHPLHHSQTNRTTTTEEALSCVRDAQVSWFCVGGLDGTTYSQWVQTNGPYGGTVRAFAVSGTNLFAGTDNGGVSTNNGTSWTGQS